MDAGKPWEIRMPWTAFDPAEVNELSGSEGVYELADEAHAIIYVGMAGGRAPFGFRGLIAGHFSEAELNPVIREKARYFRYEVCFSYISRWKEILGRYFEEHGTLPAGNLASGDEIPGLPRFTGGHQYRWGERWGNLPEQFRKYRAQPAE